ncbi:hypothetical protein [Sphingomonas sp. RIT328]|uniref:hypothetical protein n=1 Tax=Sphingomonas sp. RIT328 TaxID=1470591 RepID=UPI00044F7A5F|nr:hypothetical protein [Sphingomonas sp. RIT328]EZP50046.1 hypothetical protein BW41_03371 [Sphingomonas sp. RIT328]
MVPIVVIGKPEETVSGGFTINAPVSPSSGPPGGTNVAPLMQQNQAAAAKSVTVESDAQDEDIVVIARKIKDTVNRVMVQMTARMGRSLPLPCIPAQDGAVIRAMVGSLVFNVTTKNYGEGRAGENLSGAGTSNIPVNINNSYLKDYAKLDGGIMYLVLHEVGHSFKASRDFGKAQWESWYNSTGKASGLTGEALSAAYANSAQFALNEARANTIAKAIADMMANEDKINFTPTHGYATC